MAYLTERLTEIYRNAEDLRNEGRLKAYERIKKYKDKFKFLTPYSITSEVIGPAKIRV
jgi:hypothetical protein